MNRDTISTVYLCNVPLESDYKNTIFFEDKNTQYRYFNSKKIKAYTDFIYLRKDNLIRLPDHIDNIYNCNYVIYQNPKYKDKWFYCFIKDMKYENEECTFVEIETDVIQTWMFDYEVKPSFVEREHVTSDTIGLHTVPENLETGEYICNEKYNDETMKDLAVYIAFSDYANSKIDVVGNKYNGIYSGMAYHIFPNTAESILQVNEFLNGYDDDGKADAINSIFMAPAFLGIKSDEDPGNFTHHQVDPSNAPKYYQINIDKQTKIDSYSPRNKKLLTFPFNYLHVSNNSGTGVVYQYEHFKTEKCNFYVNGCLTPGGSIRMVPHDYKKLGIINDDEGINGGKFPICCWNSDTYTNWLTQNGVNIALSVASGIGQMAMGGAFGVVGGISTIANTLAQVHQASMIPDQARGNTNCGDVVTADGTNTFMFYKMSIKKEFAQIIDGFFDAFGYQVNLFKVPESNHMKRYWYTKTKNVNIDGAIPNNDMQKIKDCYNNGITFWKDTENMGIYPTSSDDGTISNANR